MSRAVYAAREKEREGKLHRRTCAAIVSLMLLLSCLRPLHASAETLKSPQAVLDEMTWGANIAGLFIADPQMDYCSRAPIGMGIWFWNDSFDWLWYNGLYDDVFT